MSQLEEIKARAAELDQPTVTIGVAMSGYRELLNRAIAIAEETDRAYNIVAYDVVQKLYEDLEKARAAVLALRDAIKNPDKFVVSGDTRILYTLYADTESYEQYRKTDG